VPATATGAAELISLSTSVAGQPRRLAAAQDATALPGDNRNALAMQALASSTVASSGTRTASDAFADVGTEIGTLVRTALRDRDYTDDAKVQIENLRSSISGVSLDEEMLNLTRYQRAYQGSLEVVRVADEMLSTLLALRR
jgi:flagellar hook-associated protein 1 FlgK